MLSGFAYTAYKELMESKCKGNGIQLISVNPAYTSQMGMMKFMKRYGMSSHESAACVIARKAFFFKTLSFKGVGTLSYPKKWDVSKTRFIRWMDVPYKIVGGNPARKSKGVTVKPNVHVVRYVYG